ncbi:hypothetical protein TWF694_006250 [Orbilia ellipsospora]|uniref:F-box domain-containing protein n=1 Tax=Orbilia ellipsospora TaxID=2528407 RepID=A0AAV9XJK7_9PEZI
MDQPAVKASFESLPVELQTKILFYLPFNSQVIATQTCKQWHGILLETKTALKIAREARYSSDVRVQGTYMNHLLRPETLWGIDAKIACIIRKGKIIGTYFLYYGEEAAVPPRLGLEMIPPIFALKISQSTLLDEPYISPFVNMTLRPYDPTDEEKAVTCLEIKNRSKLPSGPIEENLPTTIGNNVIQLLLQFGTFPRNQWCDSVYYLRISQTTTLREMITQYVPWIDASLKQIGVDTDRYLKAYFRVYGGPTYFQRMMVRVEKQSIRQGHIHRYSQSGCSLHW